jgi:two-component system chemotaxis response regulator CheY
MLNLDDGLAEEYLVECRERLATLEPDLLAIEKCGADIDESLANRVFRTARSIKAGAGFLDLVKIRALAHQTEEVLALIRSRELKPSSDRISILLRAVDRLIELFQNIETSNQADISELVEALARLCTDPSSTEQCCIPEDDHQHSVRGPLRVLLVEDDFASRLLLQSFLARYGECHIAVNGREAVEAFRFALEQGRRYDLICMDIMMPEMDGREAVRQVRALEEGQGILSTSGAKIIMTTAVDDIRDVIQCFRKLCDAYLVKPIDLEILLDQMKSYQLVL